MSKQVIQFVSCISAAFIAWSIWCALMVTTGEPFDQPVARAISRFLALTIPAGLFLWATQNPEREGLFSNTRTGLVTGTLASLAWLVFHIGYSFQLPKTAHAWLNVVTLSPIAEEVMFRYTAINFLLTKTSATVAVLSSAIMFAIFHLPWWLISQEKPPLEIATLTGTMFLYGLVFGLLYIRTKSIWASLIPHIANNLIALSLVR